MFIKIIKFIDNIHSSNLDRYTDANMELIDRNILLISIHSEEVKLILSQMKKARKKEIESFTEIFQTNVKNYMIQRNKDVLSTLQPNLLTYKRSDIPTLAKKLTFVDKTYIIKRLFFNDLLFHYYDLCYRMNRDFSEKQDTCERKLEKIGSLLTEIRKVKKISANELNFGSLYEYVSGSFNIYTFSKILEGIVCKSMEIKDYQIDQILHVHLDYHIYPYDSEKYSLPYKPIHHFIKFQNSSTPPKKNQDPCSGCEHSISMLKKYSPFSYNERFLDFQTLNIAKEYEKRTKTTEDTRFRTYKKELKRINSCKTCKNYCEDMLRNVCCHTHQDLLEKIRTEFFEFMNCFWIVDSILIRRNIFEMVHILAWSGDQQRIVFYLGS